MEESTIQVVIADDEPLAREALRVYLSGNKAFELVAESKNGQEALTHIHQYQPDLVLLDIEMPEMNGLDVVRKLESSNSYVVFITAFEQYAIKAFEENAIDYILKPFDKDRFEKMLERVLDLKRKENLFWKAGQAEAVKNLNEAQKDQYLKKVTTKQKGLIQFIPVESIVSIESQGAFSKLHVASNFQISNLSIKQLETLLDPKQFIRIHKSHIVNLDHIQSMESYFHGEYILHMSNQQNIKLSRSYKHKLEVIMNQYQ